MDDDQQFCLRWNNHQSTLISVFDTLLENETLVDCTLAAEGKFLKAHKVVLSACSPYFATLLSEQYDKHPIFILKDVKYQELRAMMDYMYRGEVNISQDQLAALLKAAESLQIKGLSDNRTGSSGGGSSSGLGGVGGGSGVGSQQQKSTEQHKHINVPAKLMTGSAAAGYTLEQTKRSRIGPSSIDSQDLSGSREGSSSPTSRRRKKVRRRSIENVLADNHDNSNSSQIIQAGTSSIVPTTNTSGTITAMVPVVGGAVTGATSTIAGTIASTVATSSTLATSAAAAATANIITANVTKKTESVKMGNTDAMNAAATAADNIQDENAAESVDKDMLIKEKHNHKRVKHHHHDGGSSSTGKDSEIVIEPKSEYDDEGNDETVEDLTLDDEEMGLEDLDHNAGPSHGGEGSSQGYAQWQVDRSQDEVFLAAQEAQQRDPQENENENENPTTENEITQDNTSVVQKTAQTESRIRVRNWLMLADQSILQNSIINHSTIPITTEPALPQPKLRKKLNKTNNTKTILTTSPGGGISNVVGDGISIFDGTDDTTTEVIVKIERSNSSMNDESENEDPFNNYDLKISSPMSWAFDSVKIEGSEFEEVTELEQDENTADADGCMEDDMDIDATDELNQIPVRHNTRRVYGRVNKHRSGIRKRVLTQNVNAELNLPPETTITATSGIKASTELASTSMTISNDKKYRILIQNQRMRKESLEHSEDMIYNADIEKPWVCKNCNRNYKWKNSLKCHLKNECGQPPRFFCSKLCGYATNVHSNLKRHLNTKCRDKLDLEEESEKMDKVEKIEKTEKTHYTLVIKKQD